MIRGLASAGEHGNHGQSRYPSAHHACERREFLQGNPLDRRI